MALSNERLRAIVVELVSRPRHEKVRALVYELLVNGLGASSTEVDFERPVPEVRGRIDALLGRTVFEFKSDLRTETPDAEEQLARYLADREAATGQHYVGIATDGATFVPYEIRGGALRKLSPYVPPADPVRDILIWLSSAVAVSAELDPTPEVVQRELGGESLAWHMARAELTRLWGEARDHPETRLKRDLWARLLEQVYGSPVDADDLFFQHTYLTIVAKTMAVHVMGMSLPAPADLLAGRPFQEAGITGVVESDFFDWVLTAAGGEELVGHIALQAARFRLRDVQADVLKGLYESLVDPDERHELGEYYTPDWLASRMCDEAIDDPINQRVLDPACGSGTFLFHALRRLLEAADAAGMANADALERCGRQVLGIDVHPVAVQIARVTYLLALGEERLTDPQRPPLAVPVYLGDSLQWNTRQFLADSQVLIEVPSAQEGGDRPLMEFPVSVASDPVVFDRVIDQMLRLSGSQDQAPREALLSWLDREHPLDDASREALADTYELLCVLRRSGRNHIWGFVARNTVRPVWLSQEEQRADVVIGNPPWLAYRYMVQDMQRRFREECRNHGLWAGDVAQQQDLSGYFFARCVELYLKSSGLIAFVMPYASMTRRQFAGLRAGAFGITSVRFTAAWAMNNDVRPLFAVPSCVLFARPGLGPEGPLPASILGVSGTLPRRDASPAEAERALTWHEAPWPGTRDARFTAGYASRFRQGAIIIPRVLLTVEPASVGRLGDNPSAPLVQSRRSNLEKPPWKELTSLRGNVESKFLRPLYLGESVAPFRLLEPVMAVIPWDETVHRLIAAAEAQVRGHPYLAEWLKKAERLWEEQGRGRRTLQEQLDYYGQLTAQLPPAPLRVVYSKAGTLPAAGLLLDTSAAVDHTLYWSTVAIAAEARYLLAVLNSETARARAEHLQARGQWGARHFDKVMLSLPIPAFNETDALHAELAEAAAHAERVAAAVELREGTHFVRARRMIREALTEDGVAARIDGLVADLLG